MAQPARGRFGRTRSAIGTFLSRWSMGVAVAVLLFTALIWLRLRLTTDVPRQAYADPKDRLVERSADAAGRASQPDGR
ncbi:MAG: hypothetical protein KatS3mg103_0304 [Phycisphaerales bacterium]|nr:MAG: hypothetical protein KatS3mg103_0304 [Phycisphaerales bacterium]